MGAQTIAGFVERVEHEIPDKLLLDYLNKHGVTDLNRPSDAAIAAGYYTVAPLSTETGGGGGGSSAARTLQRLGRPSLGRATSANLGKAAPALQGGTVDLRWSSMNPFFHFWNLYLSGTSICPPAGAGSRPCSWWTTTCSPPTAAPPC